MKEKKNIDRIFQEKFKDFEAEPSNKMWDRIASQLDEKEENKRPAIIPLWWKLGGAAAIIALVLASLLFLRNSQPIPSGEPGIVNQEQDSASESDKVVQENFSETGSGVTNNSTSDARENLPLGNGNSEDSSKRRLSERAFTPEDEAGKATKAQITKNFTPEKKERPNKLIAWQKPSWGQDEIIFPEISQSLSRFLGENKVEPKDSFQESEVNQLALLENKKDLEKKSDRTEEKTASSETRRLRLSTFAAPVFYKNLGGGNELSSQFAGNPTSSEVSFSYGIKIAYQLSEKLKIRTGISKLNMSSNTGGISYSPALAGTSIENLDSGQANVQIRNESRSRGAAFETSSTNALSTSIFTPGELNQQFGFIELPVELEYSLIDSRFSLNLIGGGSSLFLDRNRVDLVSGNANTSLGKAENINSTSFSTNLGLGLDYKLNDLLSISLEPVFKYQINTFENVENVKPANFGIYSGLNLRF